ncbi:hypothetical protein ANDA3_1210 [plant metagenome]|uniref:Uncharacterized protein n=1 Tax=plant metagenome TaxID=1297885 RepID=A0A484PCW1_9ZZZZ
MSRHYFKTAHKGFPITVVFGWDRPMGYFFLMIEKPAELIDDTMQVEDEDFLYSNLHEDNPFGHDLEYYGQVLHHFHIAVPETMFVQVMRDAIRNTGNRVVTYQADGSFTEREL